jgi:oligoribonuclease
MGRSERQDNRSDLLHQAIEPRHDERQNTMAPASKTSYPEKALVWIDVETTGLIAHKEQLLEVAILVTDLNLNLLDETGYQSAIYVGTHGPVALLRAASDPFVQKMHDTSGLWDVVGDPARSKPLAQVEGEALAYIKRFVPEPKTARVAGNSVRLDMNFLDEHLPSVTAHLHYRMADVSSLAGMAQWWAGVPVFPKDFAHTAMADIRESIAELRYLRARVFDGAR